MTFRDRLPQKSFDAIVIGSGPNGLAAAIAIAQQKRSVLVLEAQPTLGGGARTAELTLPGYQHDICSAIHPMALASPFLSSLPLADFGLQWIHPPAPLAHPIDDRSAAVLERDLDATVAGLGSDGPAYRRLMHHLTTHSQSLFAEALGPLRFPLHPLLMAKFGLLAIRSAQSLANAYFKQPAAKALIAGLAGHSVLPLQAPLSAAVAIMLGIAGHAVGWPVARGGSQSITNAMVSYLKSLGGDVLADCRVDSLNDLPPAKAYLFDTSPSSMAEICKDTLPERFRQQLTRFRHGPGVFKLDWALSQPIPWRAAECHRAGTIHLGGTLEEITAAECKVHGGEHPERPYILVAQQSLFDDTRAPAGKHTGWGYCHVPAYSTLDMTDTVERQIERFAPGFRDCILAKTAMSPADMQRHNANYIGGDISGGMMDFRQLFTRPTIRLSPYTTPNRQIYICSSSTPPGGGVHGMCGYFAAQTALQRALA
jgi:phytoene dehydrogenase-like protein